MIMIKNYRSNDTEKVFYKIYKFDKRREKIKHLFSPFKVRNRKLIVVISNLI